MSNLTRLFCHLAFVICLAGHSVSIQAFELYCPRAGVAFIQISPDDPGTSAPLKLAATPGAALSFPKNLKDLGESSGDMALYSFTMTDCSTSKFLCKKVTQYSADKEPVQYLLVLPIRMRAGMEFDFEGVHGLVRRGRALNSDEQVAQITLWQKVDGSDAPFELTVSSGKGLLYWDGVQLSPSGSGGGELCLVHGTRGLFGTVQIRR